MNTNEKTMTALAFIFAYFLSVLLLKYVLYDNGYSNILLLVGLACIFFYFLDLKKLEESLYFNRPSEAASLILFVLFDRSLLDISNMFLILGAACIREQFPKQEESSFLIIKEVASFICGLIYLLMGWFSAGRVLVIYFLIKFYFCTTLCLLGALAVFGLLVFLELLTKGFVAMAKGIKFESARRKRLTSR